MPLHLAPQLYPLRPLFSMPLWTSYFLQPNQFLCLQHTLRKKTINKAVVVALSFSYDRESHCSTIYRWHTTSQEFNKTWFTTQVPDEHMVFACNLRVFTWDRCHFCEEDFVTKLHHYCEGLSIFTQGEVKKESSVCITNAPKLPKEWV